MWFFFHNWSKDFTIIFSRLIEEFHDYFWQLTDEVENLFFVINWWILLLFLETDWQKSFFPQLIGKSWYFPSTNRWILHFSCNRSTNLTFSLATDCQILHFTRHWLTAIYSCEQLVNLQIFFLWFTGKTHRVFSCERWMNFAIFQETDCRVSRLTCFISKNANPPPPPSSYHFAFHFYGAFWIQGQQIMDPTLIYLDVNHKIKMHTYHFMEN